MRRCRIIGESSGLRFVQVRSSIWANDVSKNEKRHKRFLSYILENAEGNLRFYLYSSLKTCLKH